MLDSLGSCSPCHCFKEVHSVPCGKLGILCEENASPNPSRFETRSIALLRWGSGADATTSTTLLRPVGTVDYWMRGPAFVGKSPCSGTQVSTDWTRETSQTLSHRSVWGLTGAIASAICRGLSQNLPCAPADAGSVRGCEGVAL